MPVTPIWGVELRGGKILFDRAAEFKTYVGALNPGRYELVLRKRVERISKQARGYYRGVVVPMIAEAMGCSDGECHEALKAHFLAWGDGPLKQIRSTEDLGSIAYARYVDDVRRLAAEMFGIVIPSPNEVE